MTYSEAEKKTLLSIARTSIDYGLKHGQPLPEKKLLHFPMTDTLKEPKGVFVTLHHHGALRGCIGTIEPSKPLYQAVSHMAYAAAFKDPRFPPLTQKEFPFITLEISVLSPLIPVSSLEEIEVGRDGLVVVKFPYKGLLLPQVATEQGWDRETFLSHTCLKAGLPPRAYKDEDCQIYRFRAEVWGEEEPENKGGEP